MRRLTKLMAGGRRPNPAGITVVSDDAGGTTVGTVYHDATRALLEDQLQLNELLDGRALQIFTIGSTVLPLTFALLNLTANEAPMIASWILGAALVFYLVLIGCVATMTRQRLIEYRPDVGLLGELVDDYRMVPDGGDVLREWVAREYQLSIEANRPLLESKGRWISRSNVMLFVECVCLATAAGVTLIL